jgi:hypothetical protein
MPRYYFDFHEGSDLVPDQEGLELDDLEAVELEAMQTAVQLGRDWLPRARKVRLAVTDDQRRPVLAISLVLTVERLVPTLSAGHDPLVPFSLTGDGSRGKSNTAAASPHSHS